MTIFYGVMGLVVLIAILNYKAFLRIVGVGKAQVNKLAEKAEKIDPIGMYEQKIQEATTSIHNAKENLAKIKGLISTIERKIEQGEKEVETLDSRIKLALSENNEVKAGGYVSQMQTIKATLKANSAQLENYEKSYSDFLLQVESSQKKIIDAKKEAEQLGQQLELSKAEAQLGDIAHSFSLGASPLDDAARFKEEIQKQIETNRAKGIVSTDLNKEFVESEKEDEKIKQMEAKELLEKYKAQMVTK